MQTIHRHPRPVLHRMTQYGAAALLALMVIAAIGLLILGLTDTRFRLMLLAGVIVLLLVPPVLMLTTITPDIAAGPDGLTLMPVVWKAIEVPWSAVRAVKDYPLLPPPATETGRRLIGGPKRYRPAEGKMLLIPDLPAYYRFNGLFCGEGFTSVVALTNRAHDDYERLLEHVLTYAGDTAP